MDYTDAQSYVHIFTSVQLIPSCPLSPLSLVCGTPCMGCGNSIWPRSLSKGTGEIFGGKVHHRVQAMMGIFNLLIWRNLLQCQMKGRTP